MIRRLATPSSSMARAIRSRSAGPSHQSYIITLTRSQQNHEINHRAEWLNSPHHIRSLSIISRHERYMSTEAFPDEDTDETAIAEPTKDIPIKRSKNAESPKLPNLDPRAESKLSILAKSKEEAGLIRAKYNTRLKNTTPDDEYFLHLKERVAESQHQLGVAYSQAIKYSSRIVNNPAATAVAEGLLYEWMKTFLQELDGDGGKTTIHKNSILRKKWMIRTINDIIRSMDKAEYTDQSYAKADEKLIQIPPPAAKDYINILRAYSTSKAKRKGEQAESILANMMELANSLSNEKLTEIHKEWIKESIPNSKMFALAIKCYAGSTHKDSVEKINFINQVHNDFAEASQNAIPGLFINDPYVLLHSMKSLRNFHLDGEKEKANDLLGRLHDFVTDPMNLDYFLEEERLKNAEKGDMSNTDNNIGSGNVSDGSMTIASDAPKIDVTSSYLTVIRLYARLRGEKGAAAEARTVFDRMHALNDDKASSIAFVDIRANAYNLMLGMYRDSKLAEDATTAVELLTRMIDAGKKEEHERDGVPLPTNQSFEYTILSLTKMMDSDAAIKEAEKLIALMEETGYLDRSIAIYNALLTLCTKVLYGKPELYDKATEILNRLNEKSKTYSELVPDSDTISLVIKACAHSKREDHESVLKTANTLFSELVNKEESEKSAVVMKDSCYFHMMMCTLNYTTGDVETKKERVEELFSQACQRGLCSNAVLTLFRNNTTEEEYRLTVGQGRLAANWIANVTSPKALYTDGSCRGAGKNARRQGKSTSNWAKKQKHKEVMKKVTKDAKRVKKMINKM